MDAMLDRSTLFPAPARQAAGAGLRRRAFLAVPALAQADGKLRVIYWRAAARPRSALQSARQPAALPPGPDGRSRRAVPWTPAGFNRIP
jgi:hypothetical protein